MLSRAARLRGGRPGDDDRGLDARHPHQPDRTGALMAITRITQNMMSEQSLLGMQTGLGRVAKVQEQLSTGRILNRPSDAPTDTTTAMRLRSSLSDAGAVPPQRRRRHRLARTEIDATLSSMTDQIRRAREIALQGANEGAMGPQAREALAIEIDQLREGADRDREHDLPRTARSSAASPAGAWPTTADGSLRRRGRGRVIRTVADGVKIRVDVDGRRSSGPDGDRPLRPPRRAARRPLRTGDACRGSPTAIDRLAVDAARVTDAQSASAPGRSASSRRRRPPATASCADHLARRDRERRPAQGDRGPPAPGGGLPGRAGRDRPGDAAQPARLPAVSRPMTTAMMSPMATRAGDTDASR